MGLLDRKRLNLRFARLDDAKHLSQIQNNHIKELAIVDKPKSPENIRLAIGNSMLGKNNYFVMEDNEKILGYIEQNQQNNSHVMLSYPYIDLNLSDREALQKDLIKQTLQELRRFGYKYASIRISNHLTDVRQVLHKLDFSSETIILQVYHGRIHPDFDIIGNHPFEFRRVKPEDLEIAYSWIQRQLSSVSPLYITKKQFEKMLNAPKKFRDGWSIALFKEKPVGMINSFVDAHTGDIVIFGPFNNENEIEVRIPLFNELLVYYFLNGKRKLRLMRIKPFDNDKDLINKYSLHRAEQVTILTKKL